MKVFCVQSENFPSFHVNVHAENKYGEQFWQSVQNGTWERDQVSEIVSYAYSGACFLDVGASNGVYSLIMASLGCKVLAIEPDQGQFQALQENIKLNSKMIIEARRGLVVESANFSLSPYALDISINKRGDLDLFYFSSILSSEQFAVIKIDIEGGEWQLLRSKGVVRELQKQEKLILFLSPHIGFFSKEYNLGFIHRMKFRFGVLRELMTLYIFARHAEEIQYEGKKVSALALLKQDRVLGGPGIKSHIIFRF